MMGYDDDIYIYMIINIVSLSSLEKHGNDDEIGNWKKTLNYDYICIHIIIY